MNFNDTSTKVLLICVVVLTGLLVAGAVFWGSKPGAAPVVDASGVKTEGVPFVGKADAPVTILEWFDYQCPACKQFEGGALPQILANYVETGKVKIVFKDMAFLGSDSTAAAEYGRAVWKLYPEQYFAWRTAIFGAQDAEGDQGFGDAASIDALNAVIAGIDAAKVAADVKANGSEYRAAMNADKVEAQKMGITSTPSFVIGTSLLAGAHPFATFQDAIDPLLAQ
jgi:protein-disulfide isomerase